MARKYFGTDGVRDKANRGLLTPEQVLALSRALGEVIRGHGSGAAPRVGLGGDTRVSLHMIRAAVTAGLTSTGCHVVDFGVLPTPALAFLTRTRGLDLGIMISASHNPMEDNGIKVFGPDGYKLPDALEDAVEERLGEERALHARPVGADLGRVTEDRTGLEEYMTHLLGFFQELRPRGLKVAVDCANGAAWKTAPEVFTRLGAKVVVMANAPDGTNINAACGAVHPDRLCGLVTAEGCDLGVALDGDGDRSIFADASGRRVDGDHVMAFTAPWMKGRGRLREDTVVTTVMSNLGLERALEAEGIRLERTRVGDRHVTARMKEGGFSLGGEQSGHIIFGEENHYTGDGLFTALKVLEVMTDTGRSIAELAAAMQPYPQVLVNVTVRSKPPLDTFPRVREAVQAAKDALGREGRVLLRYSGTEPLARVMVEGRDAGKVNRLAEAIAAAIRKEIA